MAEVKAKRRETRVSSVENPQRRARTIVINLRMDGFHLYLDDGNQPKVEPLNRLTQDQRNLLKTNREGVRLFLMDEMDRVIDEALEIWKHV